MAAFPSITTATASPSAPESRNSTPGLKSMPTETKKSTANASRKGSDSSAARALKGDSLKIMPAKKAPSANDTPNSCAATKATPSATASTARRNSSRDPVCAT